MLTVKYTYVTLNGGVLVVSNMQLGSVTETVMRNFSLTTRHRTAYSRPSAI